MSAVGVPPGNQPENSHRGRSRRVPVRGRRSLAIGLLAAAMLAAGGTSAQALIVSVHGNTVSYLPAKGGRAQLKLASGKHPVEYHGGPVMPANTNYTLYWDPAGATPYPAGYQAGLNRYFEDLAHDSGGFQNTDSVLAQYKDIAGEFANYDSHFGGALTDTEPYPANGCSAAPVCLTDEQLRGEIARYVGAHGLPADLQHEYFLLTPPGVESCLEAAGHSCSDGTKHAVYCAYHGFIAVGGSAVVYANDPYVGGLSCDPGEQLPSASPSDVAIAGGLAHEHSESVTDPELNAWYDSKGHEVGDKCRTRVAASEFGEPLGKAPDGASYNQLINGDLYWYQQEWSNEGTGCEQRSAQPPTVKKLTPKSGPAAGGTSVTLTGTQFTPSTTVTFGGVPAKEVAVGSGTSLTAVSPAGVVGTVDVTVTTPNGTSAITKKDHFKYKAK